MTEEQWRPAPQYEKSYEVSSLGRVRRILPGPRTRRGKVLSPCVGKNGYETVRLYVAGKGKTFLIHRLVAIAFIGPGGQGMHVRHWDGMQRNNCVANLLWGTPQENADDLQRHKRERALVS